MNDAQLKMITFYHEEARQYAYPIWWHKDNSILGNGTCFTVTVGRRTFAITAAHVLYPSHDADDDPSYTSKKEKDNSVVLVLGNDTIIRNLKEKKIDHDEALDIATFELTQDEASSIGKRTYACASSDWPPEEPREGTSVAFMGFPEHKRTVLGRNVIFDGTTDVLPALDVGSDYINIEVKKSRLISLFGEKIPLISRNLGGYSGAPVWAPYDSLSKFWRPVGIVSKTNRDVFGCDAKGDEAVNIIARRLSVLRQDGSIIRRHVLDEPIQQ